MNELVLRFVKEGQSHTGAGALACERRVSPGAGPETVERLAQFRTKS